MTPTPTTRRACSSASSSWSPPAPISTPATRGARRSSVRSPNAGSALRSTSTTRASSPGSGSALPVHPVRREHGGQLGSDEGLGQLGAEPAVADGHAHEDADPTGFEVGGERQQTAEGDEGSGEGPERHRGSVPQRGGEEPS